MMTKDVSIEWPADKVERRPISELIPYARNSRTHSDTQVAQIAASIREWGWTMPILVDEDGNVIAGHGRIMAAQKLGIADVPCMTATGWSEAKRRAYVIADNKLALNAGWDDDVLKLELQDVDALGFDLTLTGFEPDEIGGLDVDDADNDALPDQKKLHSTFEVAVECKDEAEQEAVFNLLTQKGYTCRILTM
jgi:ParB-like chromosome segregation protein Spo0J